MASIILTYLPYTLVTAYTPGPNNIVALHAVGQHGWRKGRGVLWGIAIGFLIVMVICGLFCYELARFVPAATAVLKYIGAAYIVYLGIHIALSKPGESDAKSMSFLSGFLLEFANIKIILYAITVYTGYVLPYQNSLSDVLFHSLVITVIGVSGTLTWAAAGGIFQAWLNKHYRIFNIAMGLILLWCAAGLILHT